MAKTRTTWQHTKRQYWPTSNGIRKTRRDFNIVSYLLDGQRRKGVDEAKKGSHAWGDFGWGFTYLKSERPVTKRGNTRLAAHGWYSLDGLPTECNSKSFAF